jgi:hypothetical protein
VDTILRLYLSFTGIYLLFVYKRVQAAEFKFFGVSPDCAVDDNGSISNRVKDFSLNLYVQTGTGIPSPCSAYRGLMPGDADPSLQCSAEVKKEWTYTSINPYVFMAWC